MLFDHPADKGGEIDGFSVAYRARPITDEAGRPISPEVLQYQVQLAGEYPWWPSESFTDIEAARQHAAARVKAELAGVAPGRLGHAPVEFRSRRVRCICGSPNQPSPAGDNRLRCADCGREMDDCGRGCHYP